MTDRKRRISTRIATAIAATGLALALPAGALAEHRGSGARHHDGHSGVIHRVGHRRGYARHDDRHRGYHRTERRYRGHPRAGYRWGHRPRPYPVHVHGASCGHRQSSYGYYCRPCGQRYGSYDRLHHHVHHVHHVPFWKLPFVIFAKAMGHYYYG